MSIDRWMDKEDVVCIFIYVYVYMEKAMATPLQYSCLANPMDGGAWWAAVQGVAKSQTWLSDFTFTFHFHALKKEMATLSSTLAWRIPGTGEPGGLPSMESHSRTWQKQLSSSSMCIYTHTTEYCSAHKKEWYNATFSNLGGPRNYHAKWIK